MVPANSDRILRVPPYSGYHCSATILPVRGCHPLRCIFPDTSRYLLLHCCGPITPALPQQYRFGLFPFRSPLLWESIFLSLPGGTKMFQFPPFAPAVLVCSLQLHGLPHSDISGSRPVCGSPELFAAYRVLLRHRKPRHPPFALLLFLCK